MIIYKEIDIYKKDFSERSRYRIIKFVEKALRDTESKLISECIKEKEKEENNRVVGKERDV